MSAGEGESVYQAKDYAHQLSLASVVM